MKESYSCAEVERSCQSSARPVRGLRVPELLAVSGLASELRRCQSAVILPPSAAIPGATEARLLQLSGPNSFCGNPPIVLLRLRLGVGARPQLRVQLAWLKSPCRDLRQVPAGATSIQIAPYKEGSL